MSEPAVPVNTLPIRITSEVTREGQVQFLIGVGETDETRVWRYFEVRLPDDSHRVRAEWDSATARTDQGFAFRVLVDDLEPRDVVYRDGDLFEQGVPDSLSTRDDSFLNDAAAQEALRPFWVFTDAGIANARELSAQLASPRPQSDTRSLSEWAGCEADFTGAGAGIGALVGVVAGPKGILEGAAVGTVVGAAFGLGYCTAQAICG
jgi:hypothetical protein